MAEETLYTAKTGLVSISTANSNLDGTGAIGRIITAGDNGMLIKKIIVKATVNTTKGMVRIFVKGGGSTKLIHEIPVPAITKSAIQPAFQHEVTLNFVLASGYELGASTANSENFNVIAEGLNWTYYGSVRPDTTQYNTNWSFGQLTTANSNLNGTGTLEQIFSAGSSGSYHGTSIDNVIIKATGNVTDGMIRLFIYDGITKFLFKEIPVNTITHSSTDPSFESTIQFSDNFELESDFSLYASTENSENFDVSVSGNDWSYLP